MTSSTRKRIIVIGAGFGGLSAAVRLAAKGHRVTLIDKRDQLGGRAYQYRVNGFRFDGGPTVITAPYMFDEIWSQAGRRREDYFDLTPLDPFYRVFGPAGHQFDYWRDDQQALAEVARLSPRDVDGYRRLLAKVDTIFRRFHPFTEHPFLNFTDLLRLMPEIVRLQAFWGTHQYVSGEIRDPFLRQALSFHPLLVGGNPFDTPSIYTLIQGFEKEWGVHYARGGTGAIVMAFGRLLDELGVDLQLGREVEQITVEGRRATGVVADGRHLPADAVISNGDVAFTYKRLLDRRHRPWYPDWRLDVMQYSMSLVVIYFGTRRRYLESPLRHHNIVLGGDYRRMLGDVFGARRVPDQLALYLHMPSRTDASIAPPDCESFYCLALVPHLGAGVDWAVEGERVRQRIYDLLEDRFLPDLRQHLIAEHMIDPRHFRHTLNSYHGAAFAFAPTLLQSSFFRPHNRAEGFDNLYFAGSGTHPGPGVPAVLASGKIAAELIDPAPARPGARSGRQERVDAVRV